MSEQPAQPFEMRRRSPSDQLRYMSAQLVDIHDQLHGSADRKQRARILGIGILLGGIADQGEQAGDPGQQLDLATEFRIPCPKAADPGRPDSGPVLQPEPLIVQKITTGWADRFPDGWLILNPNLNDGNYVWTGDGWVYRGNLHIGVIYRWTRDEAITVAQRLAVEETRRFETWVAEQRAARKEQP